MKLFLHNRRPEQVTFRVDLPEPVARPTLRPSRTKQREVCLKPHAYVDASRLFELSQNEVMLLHDRSPEWLGYENLGWVILRDEDDVVGNAAEDTINGEIAARAAAMLYVPPPEEAQQGPQSTQAPQTAQGPTAPSGAPQAGVTAPGGVAPDPNALADIDALTPSSRWEREKLIAYAKDRGIKVADNASKNVVLKKIREASK